MNTIFWTLMVVSLNTPRAAVEIRPLPGTPAFQTKSSCEDYAKLKSLQDTVCFWGGTLPSRPSGAESRQPADLRANAIIDTGEWNSIKP